MPPSQVDVCEAAAAIEGVDEGVAAGAGGAEAADVGVGARLAVLAAGQHHHVALARPERRNDIQYRAGRPICRKVLKIMFWEVPPADWLIL